MVSDSLALLLCCFKVAESSRAAAPRGDKVLQNGEKFRMSVRLSVRPSVVLRYGASHHRIDVKIGHRLDIYRT